MKLMGTEPIYTKTTCSEIKEINELTFSYWKEEGVYGEKYLTSIIEQNLSYSYRINNQLIAVCLMYNYPNPKYNNYFNISLIIVRKGYTHKGIGKKLISYCIYQIKKKYGIMTYGKDVKFCLHVQCDNDNAIKLYNNIGFKVVNTIKNYLKPKKAENIEKGVNYDGYYMEGYSKEVYEKIKKLEYI